MATISFNDMQSFSVVYRYDSGTATFSANLNTSTTLDYFTDDFEVGDYLMMGMTGTATIGKKFRNIKINVGTAVAATSFTIRMEYCQGKGSSPYYDWIDYGDVTANFTSTGEKTISFIPPDSWNCNYFSPINGQRGWFVRFIVTAVDTPTEGGAQQTAVLQCGNNTFTASALANGDAMALIYAYDVAEGIGLISKYGAGTYVIGKCFLHIGTDGSKTTMSNISILFDKSDTYFAYFDEVEVSLTNVVYSVELYSYFQTNAMSSATIFYNTWGLIDRCSFLTSSTYSDMIFAGKSGQTMICQNCLLNQVGGRKNVFMTGTWKIKNLTSIGTLQSRLSDSNINGLVATGFSYYHPGQRSMCYNARLSSRGTGVTSTYTSSGMVNSQSDGGELYPSYAGGSAWDFNFINYTSQFYLKDKDGNPLKDVIVRASDSNTGTRSGTLSYAMSGSTTALPIANTLSCYLGRDTIIKIEDEYVRVTYPRGGYSGSYGGWYVPYCERGVWGSTAAAHSAGVAWEVIDENYYKTGYVDWDFSIEHFINPTAVIDATSITSIDYQPTNPTPLMINVTSKTVDGYITITGLDISGISISEQVDITKNGYYRTVNDFTSITSVVSTTLVATISLGLYGTFYPQHITVKRDTPQTGNTDDNPMTFTFSKAGYQTVEMEDVYVSKQIQSAVELMPIKSYAFAD